MCVVIKALLFRHTNKNRIIAATPEQRRGNLRIRTWSRYRTEQLCPTGTTREFWKPTSILKQELEPYWLKLWRACENLLVDWFEDGKSIQPLQSSVKGCGRGNFAERELFQINMLKGGISWHSRLQDKVKLVSAIEKTAPNTSGWTAPMAWSVDLRSFNWVMTQIFISGISHLRDSRKWLGRCSVVCGRFAGLTWFTDCAPVGKSQTSGRRNPVEEEELWPVCP